MRGRTANAPGDRAASRRLRVSGASRRPLRIAAVALLPCSWLAVRDLSPWLDVAATALPLVAVVIPVLLMMAAWRRSIVLGALAGSVGFALVAAVVGPWLPQSTSRPPSGIRVLSANVAGESGPALMDGLVGQAPEVLVVSEASPAFVEELQLRFVHVLWLPPQPGSYMPDVAVASKFPLHLEQEFPDLAGLLVRVEGPRWSFALFAAHVRKVGLARSAWAERHGLVGVSPARHRDLVAVLSRVKVELPLVVAGDLNTSDRTSDYRRLAERFNDAVRSTFALPTSRRSGVYRWLLLRIDHILVPRSWCSSDARRSDIPGADHVAVQAVVGPCR